MSNMLTEKRAEFVAKLEALEATRQAEIDAKVAAYRKSLEETTSKEEILKVSNVIAALDEVIGYESANTAQASQAPAVAFRATQADVAVDKESVISHTTEARPGMPNVFAPTR